MGRKTIIEYFLLSIIIMGAFVVRLYKIDNPIADWHSWRQADTSSVSRNFIKYGFDLLHPRFDDLSSLPSGKENLQGWRMVEFPFYNFFQAKSALAFPQKSLEWWGRMVSIIFSLGSLFILYFITKRYLGARVGFLAAFFFGFLPFNIYFSRVVLPEPMMVFSLLSTIYFFDKWLDEGRVSVLFFLISLFFATVTLLLKPFGAFLLLPLIYSAFRKWQFAIFKKPLLYIFVLVAFLPFFLWRFWISQYPEGIPNYAWLFNDAGIRFKGAFFRWIFAERIGKLILGFWGLPLLVLGIIGKTNKKEGWFFHFWLVGVLLYFSVVASGNVHHDYYQVIVIPTICVFLAKGANFLLFEQVAMFNRFLSYFLLFVCCIFMLAFSWYEVRDFFNINHPEIVQAGIAVDVLVPKSAKVIAPYSGDTAFLYQTNRAGWPFITNAITVEYLISKGATYYVAVNFDQETQRLMKIYKVLKLADNFVIIDLSSPK